MKPSERFEKSITKDNLWLYILSLLTSREMYGYEIRQEVKKNFGFVPGQITAYIVLKRLCAGGYIKITKRAQADGPPRTYYAITDKGRAELAKAERIWQDLKIFKKFKL
ncbi:MAG: PadR family transcriptional regulator [Candidatus Aenigmatarchaeota archaeon]